LSSALCFSAVFASGLMNGGSGWSWGREPPLWAFLLCLPRVLLTPFSWVMLDTLWYPLPLCLPALGKPNQKNQCDVSIISQRNAWHYVGAGNWMPFCASAMRRTLEVTQGSTTPRRPVIVTRLHSASLNNLELTRILGVLVGGDQVGNIHRQLVTRNSVLGLGLGIGPADSF
jgi:hypothetical protein